jgi:hypothetical protein
MADTLARIQATLHPNTPRDSTYATTNFITTLLTRILQELRQGTLNLYDFSEI